MSKYRNVKVEIEGHKFDSKREAAYYGIMKLRERAGDFHTFAMQVKFPIVVNGHKICTYIADFVTYAQNGIILEIIDCKGFKTPVYQLKKKLINAVLGITIIEK